MNNTTTLTRTETIENLRAQLAGLYAGGCDSENSPDVAALQSAVRLLRADRKTDRETVAEREFRAGTYLLIFSGGELLAAAVSALFGLSCAVALGLLGALAVLLGAALFTLAVQTICG